MLMKADLSALLVIDVQERLAPAVENRDQVVRNSEILMRAAARLGVPTLVSEQYPKGLGHTVPDLGEALATASVVEKVHFSCMAEPGYALAFGETGRGQAVIAGMEAHVCVLQTAMDLIDGGNKVFVVEDAVGSRRPESRRAALERLRAAGAQIVTTEMVVFEWLHRAVTPEFKELSKLIK